MFMAGTFFWLFLFLLFFLLFLLKGMGMNDPRAIFQNMGMQEKSIGNHDKAVCQK